MNRAVRRVTPVFHMLLYMLFVGVGVRAEDPATTKVNGTLSEIDGVRILRVWGTPEERGFAHGYLLGRDIVQLFDRYISSGTIVDAETYENRLIPGLRLIKVQPRHEAELRGMLAGIEAVFGGPANIPVLDRPVRYEDLLVVNCMGDMLRIGCSSLSAWGSMTKDGHTITGRNMDWPRNPGLEGSQIVMVHTQDDDGRAMGWVSVFWPSLIGCTTGMNSEGVTVAMHDSNSPTPSTSGDFTSSTLLYREAIESARAETAPDDITRVLHERHTIAGYNMMITRPSTSPRPIAMVFEHDGDLAHNEGMTLRKPEDPNTFLACTNHSRLRYEPLAGVRYPRLHGGLEKLAAREGEHYLTVDRAWKMLKGVSIEGILTHHSVVFEPDKRLMHVAFAENGRNAPACKHVTLDVTKLLAGDYPGGK